MDPHGANKPMNNHARQEKGQQCEKALSAIAIAMLRQVKPTFFVVRDVLWMFSGFFKDVLKLCSFLVLYMTLLLFNG